MLLKVGSGLPLGVFAAIRTVFGAAPICLQSPVHRRLQLRVGALVAGLESSGGGTVIVLLGERGAAALAPCAACTSCGPRVVPVRTRSGPLDLAASPHGLELGKRHYIRPLGSMPDRAAPSGVVVVEAAALVVEQLPPLVTVSLPDRNACRGIPTALAGGQIYIHVLPGARLQDLHPIRAEEEETRQKLCTSESGNGFAGSRILRCARGRRHDRVLICSTGGKQLTLFDRLRGPKMPPLPYGESVNVCVPYVNPSVCVLAMMSSLW